ncbi:MAG: response regulator transcription factor [Bacillota bacterium]
MQEKILVVEDEKKVRDIVRSYLVQEEYQVETVADGNKALNMIFSHPPDLIILDLMLPGLDGWEIAEEVREHYEIPILMLTARSTEDDRLKGFAKGADDYLVKPFSPRELTARVKAILKRSGQRRPAEIHFDQYNIIIKPQAGKIMIEGEDADLTGTEFNIFYTLYKNSDQVLTRDQIANKALGLDYSGFDRTIDVHIKNIRHKLNLDKNELIETVYGMGYRFSENG